MAYFQRIIQDERLFAIGFCDRNNRLIYKTLIYPDSVPCEGPAAIATGQTALLRLEQGAVQSDQRRQLAITDESVRVEDAEYSQERL